MPTKPNKEEGIGSLPDKEFRIMIIKMIQNLENKMELQINSLETRIEKMQEMFNKDLEKKSQSITNNVITEIKSTLEGTNSRITAAEYRISEVEDRVVEINEAEWKKELNKDNLKDLWNNSKHTNINIIGLPEEDKKTWHEKILEEMTVGNFLKMEKEIATQVQETQRVPNRINPRRNTPNTY